MCSSVEMPGMDNSGSDEQVSLPIFANSQVYYSLMLTVEPDGVARPQILGSGRHAMIYAARQVIGGRPTRVVAMKALHHYATFQWECLFDQEIALNREFAEAPLKERLSPILDIINLGPLVLCGCSRLYHPLCPRGCGKPLVSGKMTNRPFPALRCEKCSYELSAEYVNQSGKDLYSWRAKPCCGEGTPNANLGTIIHFASRQVMIMEVLEVSLERYVAFNESTDTQPIPALSLAQRVQRYFGFLAQPLRLAILERRVKMLGRVNLMVQIAETTAWLHGTRQVVHKDLTPDNIMIRRLPAPGSVLPHPLDSAYHPGLATRANVLPGSREADFQRLLDQAANFCVQTHVIDFGLSDKGVPTRSWYDDPDTSSATTKQPYLSQEARDHRQAMGVKIDFVNQSFRIPASLAKTRVSIQPGDIIADSQDQNHSNDLRITEVRDGCAYFTGDPPTQASHRLEIVRPLSEAHDVYALGAIFYYILTGLPDQVAQLNDLVGITQNLGCRLDRANLRDRDTYQERRNSIREPFWRDELMAVILRAMVRGKPETGSFVPSRIERGARPTLSFLAGIKVIQRGMLAEIFAERDYVSITERRRKIALGILLSLTIACLTYVLVLLTMTA
jgi:serine/threonine protein kinase